MYKVKQFGSGSEPAGCLSKQQLSNQARFKAATAKKKSPSRSFPNVGKHKKKPTQGPLKTTGRCQVDFVIFNLKIFFFPILGPLMLSDSTKSDYQLFWTRFFHSRFVVIFTIFFLQYVFFFTNFSFFKKTGWNQQCQTRGPTIDRKGSFPCLRDWTTNFEDFW